MGELQLNAARVAADMRELSEKDFIEKQMYNKQLWIRCMS
jgi:hypothetical protein